MKKYNANSGWFNESHRHKLSRLGVKTGRKCDYALKSIALPTKIEKMTSTKYKGVDFEFTFEPIDGTLSIEETADGGYVAKYLVQDESSESPDEWGDDSLFLVHYHSDFDVRKNDVITEDDARQWYQGNKIAQEKDYYIIPVKAYIHGGVRLAISNKGNFPDRQWDVSHVGLVLASKKEFKSRKQAEKAMNGLVETWNDYLSGDVYGVVADKYDKNKKLVDNDAVWGYYGSKYAMEELKDFKPDFMGNIYAGQKRVTDFSKKKKE